MYVNPFQVDNAVKAYVKNSQYEKAASLYKQINETEKAIKILLLDKEGKLLPNALQLALEYNSTEPDVPLETGCSVNEIAQRTAHYYLQKGKIGKAVDCVEHFSEVKDKVSFFKSAESKAPQLIDEAVNVLYKAEQYSDLYHLLKGKEKFERGAEIAEKLQNDQVCCEFKLLSVKKKLLRVHEYTKKDKVKEADMLKDACKKLHRNDITLTRQVDLMCGILKEEPKACFDVCKIFVKNINHFGAIEALNAAFGLKEPNLNLHKITVIVNCLQIAYKIIYEIKSSTKLSSQHLQHCRKFYLFEQSENRFFLPPSQFYWLQILENKHLPEPDSDGMMQFDALTIYKILEQHITGIAHKWLLLDLEKALFNIMNTGEYGSLNSILDKSLDIQKFVKKCYEMSDYLLCCIRLIEISHCHHENNIKNCDVGGKIDKWEKLSKYASSRILDIFSPRWRYFLKLSQTDIELIKKSKITCDCLQNMLHSGDEVTSDINTFLRNWRILKLTGSSTSTLTECLKSEENKLTSKFESKVNDQTNSKIPGPKSEEKPEIEKPEVTPGLVDEETISKGQKPVLDDKQESKNEKLVKSEEPSTTTEKHKESYEHTENSKKDLKDEETSKDSKENKRKPIVHEKKNEVPAVFIKTESGFAHSFFAWLNSCAHLENGNFMGFAEGVIKRLFILIAKRKSLKPKITVMNITSVLEVLCIGLFASLKAAALHTYKTNPLILLPKFYEHFVTSYDPINFTSHAFLDLIATSVAKSENLEQLYHSCLHLLQRILQLLLGYIEPSFNVLHHASKGFNIHGFEQCLVLCLNLIGNLWPLLHKGQQGNILHLSEIMNEVLYSQSEIIEYNFPQLFAIIQDIRKIKSTKDIFTILLNIQESNQSYIVNLQYRIESRVFSFDKIESHQFPTYVFRYSKHVASNQKKSNQGQQYQLQHHKRPTTSIPKTQQLLANPAGKPMSYITAVKQSMGEVPNISTQLSGVKSTSEMSHESKNIISKSHQDLGVSGTCTEKEKGIPVTNSELSTESTQSGYNNTNESLKESVQYNETVLTAHTPLLTEYTVPMHSIPRVTPNIPDNFKGLELTNSSHQSTLDTPQHNLDGSIKLTIQKHKHDQRTMLSPPPFQLRSNVEDFEVTVDQTQVFHDKITSTNAELQPLSTTAAYSELPDVSRSGIDVETTAPYAFIPTNSHHDPDQLQHAYAASQSAVMENTVPFQSRLKPDAESFVPAGISNHSIPSTLSINPRQVQQSTLQTMHLPSNNYQPASQSNQQQPSFPTAAYGINIIPQPLSVPYYPVVGQYMPTYGMPGPFLYSQPMFFPYQPFYPSVPWSMDNISISPYANQVDVELEDLKYYSSSSTRNVEASGNENMSGLPNDCHACGHMHAFEDEKSKVEHYASAEHLKNTKIYSTYQATISKYTKDIIDDARKIIESANTYTGTSHAELLIRAQIGKIKEWKNRFDRERGQIEDNFNWSAGQSLVERHTNELKHLKEHYEKLKTFKHKHH